MKLHICLFLLVVRICKGSHDAKISEDAISNVIKNNSNDVKWSEAEEDLFWRELGRNVNSFPPSKYSKLIFKVFPHNIHMHLLIFVH